MLWRIWDLMGYSVLAKDGSIGAVNDFLFDDTDWAVRWAVIDTGSWLPGRKVLLPPASMGEPDPVTREFPVDLTRKQVEDSPGTETDEPLSRQMETRIYDHYGWEPYWNLGYPYVAVPPAGSVPPAGVQSGAGTAERVAPAGQGSESVRRGDPDLRSADEVMGYYIHGKDDDIGHVEGFLVENGSWVIRYVIVDTKNWWPGTKVLVAREWIDSVNWSDGSVSVGLTREQIKSSPEYDPATPVERDYEERLYGHYGRTPYWV